MENRSPTPARAASRAGSPARPANLLRDEAHLVGGRLSLGDTLAIVDIGSNSVRLVVYEMLSRSAAQVFNEKEMAGLGRGVATTGRLANVAMEQAIEALKRFRILCDAMHVGRVHVIATAAARDAANGPAFIARAREAIGHDIELISGGREAYLSALGVISGFASPRGVVGDLGGGSLELIDVDRDRVGEGVSLPLGGLALMDRSKGSLKAAEKIVRDAFDRLPQIEAMQGCDFYAVGGTWRALATVHQRQSGYPLSVMHGYVLPTREASDFVKLVERVDAPVLAGIDAVSSARRPLLAYGALILDQLIRRGKPRSVVISAYGVREGLLHEQLPESERLEDPLVSAAEDYNQLRSRDPGHAADLIAWTQALLNSAGRAETGESRRLQDVACLLSDIGWRAHPDYRGEQSLNVIAHAAFSGVDHPGRAFLALAVFHRYAGLKEDAAGAQRLRQILQVQPGRIERAQLLAAIFRVAYLLSAGMPELLPRMPLLCRGGSLVLDMPKELSALASERVAGRLKQLARLLGCEPALKVA